MLKIGNRSKLPEETLPSAADDQSGAGLVDRFGRVATDLRLSVVDKCNLRCSYCMPAEGMPWIPPQMLMTAEEIARLVRVGHHELGVEELRLTGGEPLVRKDLENIVARVRADCPDLPISMTTNAVGLDRRAKTLHDAGVTRINVSLDSLHPETFAALTRRPLLSQVLDGVQAADEAGFGPIKINAVLLRGINDHEAPALLEWALQGGYELRFIEHMPLDGDRAWREDNMISASEIRELLSKRFTLTPDPQLRGGAPAERFEVRRAGADTDTTRLGWVGLISSVTEPFCAACTRTRITAEGRVRSCLFSHEETDLLAVMRGGGSDADIARDWSDAMWRKPRAHGSESVGLASADFVQPARSMSAIGG
ncbi:MAG: GTP 3',8-cyclase MoaA [Mycobacterium sp.]